jgi:hypothetical protein
MVALLCAAPLARTGNAALSPLEVVKLQLKKPNIVFVLESSQSMQGMSGENDSRFNEVGADCESGDRFCRLVGQTGRCDVTGMGLHGDGTAASATIPDTSACTLNAQCQMNGSCYLDPSTQCSADSDCLVDSRSSSMKGDFCQRRSSSTCVSNSNAKTCKLQDVTCTHNSSLCNVATDACLDGTPASMCRIAGTWCKSNLDCTTGDECVPATSRMMMAKNAIRRVILENSQSGANINFGLMHTFQADSAGLFPYLRLQEEDSATRTEEKFIPRAELLKGTYNSGPCFTESGGPTATCTIDYGAGTAITTDATAYRITYTLRGSDNSRYAVPAGVASFVRADASWGAGCTMLCPFSSTSTTGNGIYEGSYYTLSYKTGTPVTSGDGSRNQPHYYSYYRGKSFYDGTSYWVHVDAERSEFVNAGLYGQKPFTGTATSTSTYIVPWSGGAATGVSTGTACGTSVGGQWDKNVVPLVNATAFQGPAASSSVTLTPVTKGLMNVARLEKASFGGIYPAGNLAPLACLLNNQAVSDSEHGVTGYMSAVASQDTAYYGAGNGTCDQFTKERNHVILIVDGMPRGPGDDTHGGTIDCSATACNLTSTPSLSGCNCPVVQRARALSLAGTSVHVIVATSNLASRNNYAAQTLNNLAQAGSAMAGIINQPRYATNEDQIYAAIRTEMSQALRQQVAGSGASASSAAQGDGSAEASRMLLHAYSELPEWKGHLLGVAVTTSTATQTTTVTTTSGATATATSSTVVASTGVSWEASTWLNDPANWCRRRVYFSDDTAGVTQIKLTNTGSTCATASVHSSTLTKLHGLGLGANTTETDRIVRWMLGDPTYGNPAILGSITNSVPIDVGPPGSGEFPGAKNFMKLYGHRPNLVYVGSDDGMLHAFHTSDGAAWSAGQEAFAFLPRDMVPIVNRLYAQGGQRYSPDDHIYGLAGSPKVKNICVSNCNVTTGCPCETGSSCPDTGLVQTGCPVWKTALIMTAGPGGNHPFVLDVTDVIAPAGVSVDTSALLNWHAGYGSNTSKTAWESYLGETDSVPAFFYNSDSSKSDYRVVMTSGYPYVDRTSTSTGTSTSQGKTLVVARAMGTDAASKGAVVDTYAVPAPTCSSTPTAHKYTLLGDVAIAKKYTRANASSPQDLGLIGAYFGDSWGDLHQYTPSYSPKVDSASSGFPVHLGCGHPLYYSPALVQLNRFDSAATTDFFLAQVTNSVADPLTRPLDNTNFPASKLVVVKVRDGAPPLVDTTFGTSGLITLTAGRTDALGICAVTTAGKAAGATDCGVGGSFLPATARPTSSPNAIIRSDSAGFQLITVWYVAPAANWDTCPSSSTDGTSYIVLHEFLAGGGWIQIFGQAIPHEMVTGVQFVGNNLFFSTVDAGGGSSEPTPIMGGFGQNFRPALSAANTGSSGRFTKTAWIDRVD